MFDVYVSNDSKKFLNKIDRKSGENLTSALSFLKTNPVPIKDLDVKKLAGELDSYRIRIGKFRILYKVFWNEKKIRIAKIERRSDSTYN